MSQKVLTIINRPQECGEPTIDFISLETGKIIDFVSLEGFNGSHCITYKDEFDGDDIVVYDDHVWGKISEKNINGHIGCRAYGIYYIDENCTQEFDLTKQTHRTKQNDIYYIRNIEFVKRIDDPDYINSDKNTKDFMATYIHKYTLCHMKKTPVYNQENDDFYWSFKKKFDIELPYFERQTMDIEKDLLPMCAKLLNFKVINVLHY